MKKIICIVIVIVMMLIMQWHSIEFWSAQVGKITGPGFSIAIEIAMLFLWYHKRLTIIKYAAACLLIAGPWYQVSVPVFKSIGTVERSSKMIESYRVEIEQLSSSLKTFEENSKKYRRAANRVEPTQDKLDAVRAKYRTAISSTKDNETPWRMISVSLAEVLALFIILSTQLLSITILSECSGTVRNVSERKRQATSGTVRAERPDNFDEMVRNVKDNVLIAIDKYGSQSKFAHEFNLRKADICALMNHEDRKVNGGEIISMSGLKKIEEVFG